MITQKIKLSDFSQSDLVILVEAVARAHAKTKKHIKPKMQFSKIICIFGMVLVTATIACNVMLSLLGCATLSDVTMTVVSVFGGFATGGYFALSGVRDCSKNKHHIEIEEVKLNENE